MPELYVRDFLCCLNKSTQQLPIFLSRCRFLLAISAYIFYYISITRTQFLLHVTLRDVLLLLPSRGIVEDGGVINTRIMSIQAILELNWIPSLTSSTSLGKLLRLLLRPVPCL